MFDVSTSVVATLALDGLAHPPVASTFSRTMATSYFEDAGVDVSLIWISAEYAAGLMAQHRENQATPLYATIRRLGRCLLGAAEVDEVVYWKARPSPELGMMANEASWQYLWPVDQGRSYGLLTLWRSGTAPHDALAAGFDRARARWSIGPSANGVAHRLVCDTVDGKLVLTACCIRPPDVEWGRILVPAFHESKDWFVSVKVAVATASVQSSGALTLVLPLPDCAEDLADELAQVTQALAHWSVLFANIDHHLCVAAESFRRMAEADSVDAPVIGPLDLLGATMEPESDAIRLSFATRGEPGEEHEGTALLHQDGRVSEIQVWW